MTAVQLPRRLPDREPERSDPPSEADWLRRAIRCCEHWGRGDAQEACLRAYSERSRAGYELDFEDAARWLPEHLRNITLGELRLRLEALETAPCAGVKP